MIFFKYLMLLLLIALYTTLASAIRCQHRRNTARDGPRFNEETIFCEGICFAVLELNGSKTRVLKQGCDETVIGKHFNFCKKEKECKPLDIGKDNRNQTFCCCIADHCNSSQNIFAAVPSLFENSTTTTVQPGGEKAGGCGRWNRGWNTKSILLFAVSCFVVFVVFPLWIRHNCYKRGAPGESCRIWTGESMVCRVSSRPQNRCFCSSICSEGLTLSYFHKLMSW